MSRLIIIIIYNKTAEIRFDPRRRAWTQHQSFEISPAPPRTCNLRARNTDGNDGVPLRRPARRVHTHTCSGDRWDGAILGGRSAVGVGQCWAAARRASTNRRVRQKVYSGRNGTTGKSNFNKNPRRLRPRLVGGDGSPRSTSSVYPSSRVRRLRRRLPVRRRRRLNRGRASPPRKPHRHGRAPTAAAGPFPFFDRPPLAGHL